MQSDKIASPAERSQAPTAKKGSKKATTKKAPVAEANPEIEKTTAQKEAVKTPKKAPAKKTATKTATKTKTATATKAAAKKTTKSSTTSKTTGKLKIRFEIFFSTKFGEALLISGAHPALGAEATIDAPVMQYINDQKWAVNLELDKSSIKDGQLSYTYLLRYDDGALTLSAPYQLNIPTGVTSITVRDSWNAPGFENNALLTDALQAFAIEAGTKKVASSTKKKFNHRFIIKAPALEAGKAICLIGQEPQLGGWDPAKALLLENQVNGNWQVDLSLKLSEENTGYKYGIYDLATGQLESFETGENRILQTDNAGSALLIQQDGFIRTN